MKYSESPGQAADYLRLAVPLMVSHKIPPNPLNYALWYTYVSNTKPALNAALDATVRSYGTCPASHSESLFREHLLSDATGTPDSIQAGLVKLVGDLSDQAAEAAAHTGSYSSVLRESLEALNAGQHNDQPPLPLESILRTLTVNTEAINETTQRFQQQIDAAQQEIQALKRDLAQARLDARIDPLTGLSNRRMFDTELNRLLEASPRPALHLILIDVDHFKRFNDSYGHLMGDKVLCYVGQLLQDACPEPLLAARFGGEEFAVLVPELELDAVLALAEQLRQRIEAIRIRQKSSGTVISSISASFGVATLTPEDDVQSLIDRVDQALYQAKDSGRNRVCGATG